MLYDLLELDIRNPERDPDLGTFLDVVKAVVPGELTFAQKKMIAFAPLDCEVYEPFLSVYDKIWKAGNETQAGSMLFAYQIYKSGGGKSNSRPVAEKSGEKKNQSLEIMTLRAQGVKVRSFAVKPPMTLGEAIAQLQKSAPGILIQVQPLKDGMTPVVPQVRVEDASVFETAKILCETVDYSVRMTPRGILAEPKN